MFGASCHLSATKAKSVSQKQMTDHTHTENGINPSKQDPAECPLAQTQPVVVTS